MWESGRYYKVLETRIENTKRDERVKIIENGVGGGRGEKTRNRDSQKKWWMIKWKWQNGRFDNNKIKLMLT